MNYWLVKTEPQEFSIDDLKRVKEEPWSGVRNYAARNYMMRDMKVEDMVLFYHSSCEVPGVYGLAKVSHLAEPDQSQFDKKGDYFDPKATKERPIWQGVRVRFVKKLKHPVPLTTLKKEKKLQNMFLFKNGRLSVGPVTKAEYEHILKLAEAL
jgi:predicted RNA-binding protein with PUA-like domain